MRRVFDSVHRETLWKLLKSYGIPDKLVNMIKAMYRNSKCAVIGGTETSQAFSHNGPTLNPELSKDALMRYVRPPILNSNGLDNDENCRK